MLVWLFAPVFVKRVLHASFFEFQAPIEATASYLHDLQDYWTLRSRSKHELIEAGRDLARINASYALAIQQDHALRAELDRQQQLLHIPPQPGHRLEHARVMRRDFSAWWQRLTVRKGRNYGIPVGAPVVFAGGVVGIVSEVHAYTAVVDLISSPHLRLAAMIEGDERPISYQGGLNPTLAAPHGVIEFVPLDISPTELASAATRNASAARGGTPNGAGGQSANGARARQLLTSGLGGIFPAGLRIGRITHLEPNADGLFQSGEVQLDARLSSLREVTILVPIGNDEAERGEGERASLTLRERKTGGPQFTTARGQAAANAATGNSTAGPRLADQSGTARRESSSPASRGRAASERHASISHTSSTRTRPNEAMGHAR
ncbi:rod shape-determining protein MreC [Cephaloticoccus primus]|uniref:rod shape-determining protein MreC n=1 Tax=Cephaloticoccus primus TaxID=1548207 RepID=UPI000839958D|nr:rod shape-determining protein MreC [Cephaloticoccus primus]